MDSPSLLAPGDTIFRGGKVSDEWCRAQLATQRTWLAELDRDPTPLLAWLAERESPLLGRYFENLVSFWMDQLPGWECLAQNLVVGDGVRHLGEFDLLLRHRQQLYHWELSVKFYLQVGDRFLGPNPKDSLARKLARVFDHQLCLSQQPPAKRLLVQRFGSDTIQSMAFLKGYLFYPVSGAVLPGAASGISPDHLRGWWLRMGELEAWLATRPEGHRWLVLEKLQWLAPALRSDKDTQLSRAELLSCLHAHFASHAHARLVVELAEEGDGWREVTRGIVVDAYWPRC